MKIAWNEEQKKVIETRNADILVSAAAGSGRLQKKKVDCFFSTDDSAIFFHKNMLQ